MGAKYRIGIDASLLADQPTGIGRYTYEVLRRLVYSQEHEWFLYSHRPLIIGEWNQPNVHVRAGHFPRRLVRMLWVQTVMPHLANADKVDLFWSPAHRLPGLLPRHMARVVTIHDLVWRHAPETMRPLSRILDERLMPIAVKMADQIITVSNHTAMDVLKEMPFASGKTCVTQLGITVIDSTNSREALTTLGLDTPYVLFVGTLEPRKNLPRLFEAYSRLSTDLQQKACIAIVGGKGWGGVNVQDLVRRFKISSRVRVLGYVSDEQLSALYTHALFLAMPSLYEGFGLPLLEAMARGTPVLTSQIASMPEVAGKAGYLVDPYDVNSISNGLSLMIGDNALRAGLATNCRDIARRFSWDRVAEDTLDIFDKAINIRRDGMKKI